jgi:sensor domain CHASE-containing protein
MNVSRKILVIIYIIFALLIPVVIFAPQNILYSSFSDLQEEEATDIVEKIKDIIKFQILDLVKTNAVLSSREDA